VNEQEDKVKKDYVSPIIEPLGTVSNLTMMGSKDNNDGEHGHHGNNG
jgi:hypothetical protein